MKYFSMFSGVGGFELGIQKSIPEAECVGYSEINKYAIQIYKKHFKEVKNYGDATKIKPEELPDFDMLCGGFPCQSFSIAGKRKGFEDTRGTMFFEIERILKVKKPKIVFLENVKGLLNHNKGETFRVILQTLDELGYNVEWMVLNSKFFGVPQNRERVFIIGSIRGERRSEILPFGKVCESLDEGDVSNTLPCTYGKIPRGATYIKKVIGAKSQHSRVYSTEGISPTLAGASKLSGDCTPKIVAMRGRYINNKTKQKLEPNSEGICNTLSSVQKDNLVYNKNPRRLTPTECERLQGFPDNWTKGVSDTQRYKAMGNAVTVNVIKAITSKLSQ